MFAAECCYCRFYLLQLQQPPLLLLMLLLLLSCCCCCCSRNSYTAAASSNYKEAQINSNAENKDLYNSTITGRMKPVVLPECAIPNTTVDIMWIIDNTVSMEKHEPFVREYIPKLLDRFHAAYPHSQFGLVTFNDEDIHCKEQAEEQGRNYGARVEIGLNSNSSLVKDAAMKFSAVFGDLYFPEDAMGALLVAALNDKIGWRPLSTPRYKRMMVQITDAAYRTPLDRKRECLSTNPLQPNNGDGDYDNKIEDYPSTAQVSEALKRMEIYVTFIILTDRDGENHGSKYMKFLSDNNIRGKVFSNDTIMIAAEKFVDSIDEVVCIPSDKPGEPVDVIKVVGVSLVAGFAGGAAIAALAWAVRRYYGGSGSQEVQGGEFFRRLTRRATEKDQHVNVSGFV